MNEQAEEPRFHLFRLPPADLRARPPLASSMQSFESSLFLVALRRYPHALTACVFAIESALKAAFNEPSARKDGLQELLTRARRQAATIAAFSIDDLDSMRDTRNRIVHSGFSPKADGLAATLLLRPAIPLLRACYDGLLSFSLDDALLQEYYSFGP